ncbi:hypothetical protein PSN45_004168 [Yamadazyma tenuis]|uniref:uncharacterized protein n=1 Tax=Candida tenuis TaxID=2315449 RepID=UPI00279FCBAB|nr:hypothetical protein PSN45_004168 [Yamadazyma tenuis]
MFRLYLGRAKFPKFSFKPFSPYRLAFVPLLHPIFNDSGFKGVSSSPASTIKSVGSDVSNLQLSSRHKTYNELTLGSVTGLFLGIIIGKFSSLIVTLTLSVYLVLQFLQSRGVIQIPWNYIFRFNNQSFDTRQLFFDNFNFKISFISSFLIACYNI